MKIVRGQVESIPGNKTNVLAFVRHLPTQKKEQLRGEAGLEYAILRDGPLSDRVSEASTFASRPMAVGRVAQCAASRDGLSDAWVPVI